MKADKLIQKFCALIICISIMSGLMQPAHANRESGTVSLPIIMYHHIHKNQERWGEYIISEKTLENDLEYLKNNGYETVTAKQLISYANGEGTLPEKPVMITFDDGQESFMVYALPLLEKYGMSAVLAIVGSYADMDNDTVHNVAYSYLSWDQLAELSRNPYVELQNHSYAMHNLQPRSGCKIMKGEAKEHYKEVFAEDLKKNEKLFIEHFGTKPICFAYPFGQKCEEALEVLKEEGYQAVFTCEQRVNELTRNPGCLLDLGRFNRPDGISTEQFFEMLK